MTTPWPRASPCDFGTCAGPVLSSVYPMAKKRKSTVDPAVSQAASIMGRKGGSKKGKTKARTSEQARAAANKRWEKQKKK